MSSYEAYELQVPGEAKSLSLIRMVVTSLAEDAGLPQEEIDKIEVAVDEACTNVLDHAYENYCPHPPVRLMIHSANNEFVIDVEDEGTHFDFEHHKTPKFPEHWWGGHTRGAGIFLIKKCMDNVHYERLPNEHNRLRLIKKIH
ncbi:MAG: ATP-binding protein [Spartobacteria bacterium]|nr:ATP-binding protein [Spartobacteria bacterium]